MPLQSINAKTAKNWLDKGEAIIVDVREPAEHRAQRNLITVGANLQSSATRDLR